MNTQEVIAWAAAREAEREWQTEKLFKYLEANDE